MRIFIAFSVSEDAKQEVGRLQGVLKPKIFDPVRWVAKENIHLTLEFLGEADEEKLREVRWVLEHHSKKGEPFRFVLEKVNAFPHVSHAQTLVVNLGEAEEAAYTFRKMMHEELSLMGLTQDFKPWKPHLTLGRIKTRQAPDVRLILGEVTVQPIAWEVRTLELIESQLTPEGPRYNILQTFNLG